MPSLVSLSATRLRNYRTVETASTLRVFCKYILPEEQSTKFNTMHTLFLIKIFRYVQYISFYMSDVWQIIF